MDNKKLERYVNIQKSIGIFENRDWIKDYVYPFFFNILSTYYNTHKIKFIDPLNSQLFIDMDEESLQNTKKKNGTDLSKFELLFGINKPCDDRKFFDSLDILIILINSGPYDGSNISSHWSVMSYFVKTKKIYIYDSMGQTNLTKSMKFILKLERLGIIEESTELLIPKFFPSQQSNWECGYYVMQVIKMIVETKSPLYRESLGMEFTSSNLDTFIKWLIVEFSKLKNN